MDAATDSKVEVKGSMNVTNEQWNAIFGSKDNTEEVDGNDENN